jgi:hypothetical protein
MQVHVSSQDKVIVGVWNDDPVLGPGNGHAD